MLCRVCDQLNVMIFYVNYLCPQLHRIGYLLLSHLPHSSQQHLLQLVLVILHLDLSAENPLPFTVFPVPFLSKP